MKFIVFNGKTLKEDEANIPIIDKAYFFDFAVYTSIKVVKGKIFFPKYHVDRLFESAKIIGLNHQFSREEVLEWLKLTVEKNKLQNALLRVILIGDADENKNAKLYIIPFGLTFYPEKFYKRGVKVITFFGERFLPNCKSKSLLLNFLALREAQRRDALEALLVDKDGNIREGTRSNFFVIKDDTLVTPPKEKVLEGITKKIVLKVSKKYFKIKEKDIPLKMIKEFDECFITSTSMNVMPIRQIDDFIFDTQFEKTRIIQKLFKEFYHKNVLTEK